MKKLLCILVTILLMVNLATLGNAFAFEGQPKDIVIKAGTTLENIEFPMVLTRVDDFGNKSEVSVSSWVLADGTDEFNCKVEGTYIFNPVSMDKVIKEVEQRVLVERLYQNPQKYYQISDRITLKDKGNYKLDLGRMGLKVLKVNNYFNIGSKNWPRYTVATKSKVRNFQRQNNLRATGVVDLRTWLKMGFSKDEWYNLGAYVTPTITDATSTREDHIEAMIKIARRYRGDDYVVGASGKPGEGVDCSGLVMQALYGAGIDLDPINPVRHSKKEFEFESRNIYNSNKLKAVKYSNKKRGDLIFYSNSAGRVNHIAIYIGNDKVIEALPNKVVISKIKAPAHPVVKGVKRVFV